MLSLGLSLEVTAKAFSRMAAPCYAKFQLLHILSELGILGPPDFSHPDVSFICYLSSAFEQDLCGFPLFIWPPLPYSLPCPSGQESPRVRRGGVGSGPRAWPLGRSLEWGLVLRSGAHSLLGAETHS